MLRLKLEDKIPLSEGKKCVYKYHYITTFNNNKLQTKNLTQVSDALAFY